MTFAYLMVLVAGLLPYATILAVKGSSGRDYDNTRPREWLEGLTGWRQRGEWAHRNHFEAFPFFAAGVLVAVQMHVKPSWIDDLAGAFVAFRVAYTWAYFADVALLRSVCFIGGLTVVVALFLVGLCPPAL